MTSMNNDNKPRPIDPQVRIGHIHLKVADLERSLRFYCGVLGFQLTQRYGTQAEFVSAGGYHQIGLNTWESLGGSHPPAGTTGLYHVAIVSPTRRSLADALRRQLDAGIRLDGASDHGVSEALSCVTRTTTAWNCIGTAPRRRGHESPKETWRCSPGGSTWVIC
jgi:catechol 2,3-dioxygenase